MGYGLFVRGVDTAGEYIYTIDSDLSSTKFLGVSKGGLYTNSTDARFSVSGTIASPTTISGYNSTHKQLVFARTSDAVSEVFFSGETKAMTDCEVVILSPIDNTTYFSSNVNGSYGLQVYNSASLLIFDSRKITQGFDILLSYEYNAFPGGYTGNTTAGNLVYDASAKTTAQWRNTYVSMIGSHYADIQNNITKIGAFHFDHGNQKIYYVGYGGSGNNAIGNRSAILVGEFKE